MAGFISVITRAEPGQRGWLSLIVMNTAAASTRADRRWGRAEVLGEGPFGGLLYLWWEARAARLQTLGEIKQITFDEL